LNDVALDLTGTALRVFHVDPGAPAGGDGSEASPFNSVFAVALQAGDTLLLKGGTEVAGFLVGAQGTADSPITIGSYGTGPARILGTMALDGARHVTLENLEIVGGAGYGVMLTGGASDCTVRNCEISEGLGGVLLQGAGLLSNAVLDCDVHDNDYAGIAFNGAVAGEGQEITIAGNTIWRNGQQGILLHASWVVVDGNTVVNNGLSGLPGMSAIHVVGTSPDDDAGKHNTITDNVVAYQRDGSSLDGNGIMLDHWSNGAVVSGNHVFGNDGVGISVLSSGGNTITGNIVHDNMVDAGGTHVVAKAEIFVGETTLAPGLTVDNIITGNTAVANSAVGAAVQVAADVTSVASNVIYGNELRQSGAGPLWMWGAQSGARVAGWNALAHGGSDADLAGPSPVAPGLQAAWLAAGFVLHSGLLTTVAASGLSMLVAHAGAKDITGPAAGAWMAGDGRDNVLTAVGGDNMLSAGSGNAVLIGGPGQDMLFGGAGDLLMVAGANGALMIGGAGNSRLIGGAGVDTIFAGNGGGSMLLWGGGGGDLMVGGGGVDTFVVGDGLDIVLGFTHGQDKLDVSLLGAADISGLTLFGGPEGGAILDQWGEVRVIIAGFDPGLLTADDLIFSAPAASATVSVAAAVPYVVEGRAGAVDVVFTITRSGDLSRADSIAWSVAGHGTTPADAADFVGGVLPSGRVTFLAGESSRSVTVQVAGDSDVEQDEAFAVTLSGAYSGLAIGTGTASVIVADDDSSDTTHCFAPGTMIATPFGPRAAGTLRVGDAVLTLAGQARRLVWTGQWRPDPADAAQCAVRVRAGAFGPGRPARDLVVSPGHGLWFAGARVPAAALVDGVRVLRVAAPERYVHFACARHEVVLAEGLAVETFLSPEEGMVGRNFPEVADPLPLLECGAALEALRATLGLATAPGGARAGFLERIVATPRGTVVEGWASDPAGPARLVLEAGGRRLPLVANRWRTDLDRAGLPAAGFRAELPAWVGMPRVWREDGAALARPG